MSKPSALSDHIRPRRRSDLKPFPVADELVLVAPGTAGVFALNRSGAVIWNLCDGRHSLAMMLAELRATFAGDGLEMLSDLSAALLELQALGLVETRIPALPTASEPAAVVLGAARTRPDVHFVFGIEDRTYFHWQLAILFESMVGQLPAGWDITVVVCNGHTEISPELRAIAAAYDVVLLTGMNLGRIHNIDFADGGEDYVAMNRVEALATISPHVPSEDVVCLMDTDMFLFGDLRDDLFPTGNAVARNWIISQERYFQFATEDERGLSLTKLLEALGCEHELQPGGVTVFLAGATLHDRKYVKDCFRFLQVLYLLAKVNDIPARGVWVSEMACFALALTANGIATELLETPQFSVQEPALGTVPEGSFFHYYTDVNDGGGGPFPDSQWHKQLYHDRNLLADDLDAHLAAARSPVEKRFFELARRARGRFDGTDRHP